jgi:hypothetical protein
MKRALVFYPVNVEADQPDETLAEFVHARGQLHPEHPLIIAAKPHGAQVYLVVGASADLADEVFVDRRAGAKPWPDLPVIWADGGPEVYGSIGGFMSQTSITLEDLLRVVYGTLSRQALVEKLTGVLSALDDASSVVDAGEGEAYAYQSELHDLRVLLDRLQRGAYLVEEPLPVPAITTGQ